MLGMLKKKKKYIVYVTKYNSNLKKQVILLMISNGEKREGSRTLATRAKCKGRKAMLAKKIVSIV